MRMNLKGKRVKKFSLNKVKFTSKNLFIFLISLGIVTIVLGILFYFLLSSGDKTSVDAVTKDYFEVKTSYDYLSVLKESILKNSYNTFLIWVLGISVIGVIATVFIYFCELFSIGFTIGSIFNVYSTKGIIASLLYLIPTKICYIAVIFLLTFFAIKISYKLVLLCFTKQEINIKNEIRKHFKILLFSFISMIAISMLTAFIDPLLINLFNKI